MIKIKKNNQEKGGALLLGLVIILSASLFIGTGLTFLTLNSAANAQTKVKSTQSYYLSEAGIEDMLLRLKNGMQVPSSNVLTINGDSTTVETSDPIGGSRTITSQGDVDSRIRKLAATYYIDSDAISFHYGAQAGEDGVLMNSGSQIQGNIFSNGSLSGSGEVTDTVTIANNGNIIDGISVGGDVYTYSCSNTTIGGTLYYVSGGSINNCSYTDIEVLASEIASEDMPISQAQIIEWKDEATAGGIHYGDYVLENNQIDSLGPIKITGNIIFENNAILTVTGVIHVQGDVTTQNNATIKLSDDFESLSGMIISDGRIAIGNNIDIEGSAQAGSYLMLLSTDSSVDPNSPAIDLNNNAEGAIFYAPNGLIYLHNNITVKEVTGHKLILDNNAEVVYETGLANINFSSGPGGGWQVSNWREIE